MQRKKCIPENFSSQKLLKGKIRGLALTSTNASFGQAKEEVVIKYLFCRLEKKWKENQKDGPA